MTRENEFKINQLLKGAPKNAVLTTTWLREHGISDQRAWWYAKSGWFNRIAIGAYCFADSNITWSSAVRALQQQLNLPIHVGGKTALQVLGKGHYVNMAIYSIQLFSAPKTGVPRWLQSDYWKESFIVYQPNLFKGKDDKWLTNVEIEGQSVVISSPEKAALELCYLVPNHATFSEVALIIEGLVRMRPKLLQSLLQNCQSYKTKRLFLYLAEYFQHSWVSEIDITNVDLGTGKRVIAGGGHYNDKYKISVPKLENNT